MPYTSTDVYPDVVLHVYSDDQVPDLFPSLARTVPHSLPQNPRSRIRLEITTNVARWVLCIPCPMLAIPDP